MTPALAFAQDVGADEVTLKNGGTIRGTIVSSEPGTSVKILEVGSREPRVVPWSQVADVQKNKYGAQQQPAQPPVQPGTTGAGYGAQPSPAQPREEQPPEPQLGAPGVVRVHIASPEQSELVAHDIRFGAIGGYGLSIDNFTSVCQSPCDRVVDANGKQFSIQGDFPESRLVSFNGMKGDVLMTVAPGSFGRRSAGFWSVILGGVGGLGIGGTLLILGAVQAQTFANTGIGSNGGDMFVIGGITTAVGVALMATGIVLIATSGTHVDIKPAAPHDVGAL